MEAVRSAIEKSGVQWQNVDIKQLLRYVSMTLSKEDVEREELGEVLPVPKGTTTFHSFTNPKKRAKETNGDNQFHNPVRSPTKDEIQRCIGIMVSETVRIERTGATKILNSKHFFDFEFRSLVTRKSSVTEFKLHRISSRWAL